MTKTHLRWQQRNLITLPTSSPVAIILAVGAFFLCTLSSQLSVASPLSTVGSASVTEGRLSIETRAGYVADSPRESQEGRLALRHHFDYGVTDYYAFRLIGFTNKPKGENIEFQRVSFENRFHFFDRDTHGWDGGMRFIYGHADGDDTPGEIDVRFMAQVPFAERWEWRHNMIFEHDIGADSHDGIALELRNQVKRRTGDWWLGLETYHDFGRLNDMNGYDSQSHFLGGVIKRRFENGAYFQTTYRQGISDAANDHVFEFSLGKRF